MNVGERIKKRRKQLKMSVDELAEKLGKNRATIYRYESSEIENMPITILEPLSKALNVSPAYLMGWEEEEKTESEYIYYPTSISAGATITAEAVEEYQVDKITIPDSLMGKWAGNKDIFIMRVNGDSMNCIMPHNSIIAVKEVGLSELKNGDIVVYSQDNEYAVKRFYRDENKLIFRPDSTDPRFTDHIVDLDTNATDIKIHGKVVLYIVELE